jgi:hypothetical protein
MASSHTLVVQASYTGHVANYRDAAERLRSLQGGVHEGGTLGALRRNGFQMTVALEAIGRRRGLGLLLRAERDVLDRMREATQSSPAGRRRPDRQSDLAESRHLREQIDALAAALDAAS